MKITNANWETKLNDAKKRKKRECRHFLTTTTTPVTSFVWWRTRQKERLWKKGEQKFIYLILMDFNAIACWLLVQSIAAWLCATNLPPSLRKMICFVYRSCTWRRRVGNLSSLFPLNMHTHTYTHYLFEPGTGTETPRRVYVLFNWRLI